MQGTAWRTQSVSYVPDCLIFLSVERDFNGRGTSWSEVALVRVGKERIESVPVFAFGGDAELLDLALEAGEALGGGGEVHELQPNVCD